MERSIRARYRPPGARCFTPVSPAGLDGDIGSNGWVGGRFWRGAWRRMVLVLAAVVLAAPLGCGDDKQTLDLHVHLHVVDVDSV